MTLAIMMRQLQSSVRAVHCRLVHTSAAIQHNNPLVSFGHIRAQSFFTNSQGLPNRPGHVPQVPRRGGPISKRPIPHVNKVVVVASGKGGVGKSTVAGEKRVSAAVLES